MNTYDWLRNLPIADTDDACRVVEISFNQGSRKDYYRNATLHYFEKGDLVALEGVSGFDVGEVSLTGEIVRLQLKKRGINEAMPDMKKVLRRASDRDLDIWKNNKSREKEAVIRSRAIAKQLALNMKISQVEFQADGKKATFYYIADDRVDFRELIKIYAAEFRVKVEMRQIGARQESGKVGGIGACGRELCCATWLTDFKSVNTAAARYQNLSINQTKLSGQCGRLKCCLNYELDTYLDALQGFPENCDMLQVQKGTATLIKKDIFKNLMWYVLPQSTKQYPLTIERVRKIKTLNQQNVVPDELEAVEVVSTKPKEVEPEFVDVVGQISLRSLEKADKKRRDRIREQRGGNRQQAMGNKQQATGNRQAASPKDASKQQSTGNGQQAAPQKQGQGKPQPVQPKQGETGMKAEVKQLPTAAPRPAQQGKPLQKPLPPQGQRPQGQKPAPQRESKPQEPRPANPQRPPRPQGQGPQRKPQEDGNKEQPNPE